MADISNTKQQNFPFIFGSKSGTIKNEFIFTFAMTIAIFMCHRDSRTNPFPSALLNFPPHERTSKDPIDAVKEGVLRPE